MISTVTETFWLISFINQTALYNHALAVAHRPASLPVSSSGHTSPSHRLKHRNFILGTDMHLCPSHMHIKYSVILTCSFKCQPFWYLSLICYPAHTDNHRDFILHIHSVPHNSNSLISNYCLFRRPPSAPKITPLTQC